MSTTLAEYYLTTILSIAADSLLCVITFQKVYETSQFMREQALYMPSSYTGGLSEALIQDGRSRITVTATNLVGVIVY